jgi:hypothetical protein
MRSVPVILTTAICVGVAGCDLSGLDTVCSGLGYYALNVTIKDSAGTPQALGALVTLYDGTYQETDSTSADPVAVSAADERGGHTYDIKVTKPWYVDTWVRNVHTAGGGCVTNAGDVTITVPVTLHLAPNAPPVRSLHLVPFRLLLDRSPYRDTATFAPYLDADAGVSHDLGWRVTGDTGSVVFASANGGLTYRCLSLSGYLTVTAFARADSSVHASAEVAVQGHPAATNDPPCSGPSG